MQDPAAPSSSRPSRPRGCPARQRLRIRNVYQRRQRRRSGKVPLVLYAAEGYDTAVAAAFQKATGIPTSVYDAHTGIVVSKIEQEKNNPQWGVTWFDGDMAMSTLDSQGLLLKGWQPTAAWNAQGQQFLPADKSYVPTGYTIAAGILYNSKAMPNPPTSWNQLLSSTYSSKLGILNPAIDGPAYPWMAGWAAQMGGVPQMESYTSNLVKGGTKIYNAPADELNAIKQGTIDVAVAQSSYGISVEETNPYMKVACPKYVTPVPVSSPSTPRRRPPSGRSEEVRRVRAEPRGAEGHAGRRPAR